MSAPPPDPGSDAERIRLLEHQLDYLRAELLHLTHERFHHVYSAAWLIYTPLRAAEAALVRRTTALWRRLSPQKAAVTAPRASAALAPLAVVRQPAARLLVDVTGTAKRDAGTGIQRVVKEVARALHSGAAFELPALAVRSENGRLYTCHAFLTGLDGVDRGADVEVAVAPGDRLLMLSDSWNAIDELAGVVEAVRGQGGEIISCIFDLIPELYPHACHEVTVPRYHEWLRRALLDSDAFLAISRSVADELADFIATHDPPRRPGLKIGWFHCGADLAAAAGGEAAPRPKIRAAAVGPAPTFLSVGTIEPRKGARVALQAFEQLWDKGVDATLTFVGRRGWFEEAVCAEILRHREFGARLFWFDDASDAELTFLYDTARALIFASYAEGFGLPIVEAAQRGRAVICSDIPVFREVGRDGALYFRVNDPGALATAVEDFLSGRTATAPARILQTSWLEAAQRIVAIVARDDWSHRLDGEGRPEIGE